MSLSSGDFYRMVVDHRSEKDFFFSPVWGEMFIALCAN